MEARLACVAILAASFLSLGASYRTQNFIVTAHSPQLAKQVGDSAETLRRDLAMEWLGHELPNWMDPCPIAVQAGNIGAGGVTSFMFDRGRPFGWEMSIQGTPERILDSVLPHEITHTIFATHFGQPLPRWADEGACTTVEHPAEKQKQHQMLLEFLTTGRGIAFNQMFAMREYPADIMPLYSQGFSLARYLIAQGGKPKFVQYVGDGLQWNNWTAATRKHYGYESLSDLQVQWLDWVRQGSPQISSEGTQLARNDDGLRVTPVSATSESARQLASADGSPAKSAQQETGSWYVRVRDSEDAASADESRVESDISYPKERTAAASAPQPAATRVASPGQVPSTPPRVLMEWSRPAPHSAGMVRPPQYQPPPAPRLRTSAYGPPSGITVLR
ncbi:MAG: hypothetical protein KDA62_16775 [Planctomycetales bacterium]|nr:hypothetical protein [Planctomycetales bacterium]